MLVLHPSTLIEMDGPLGLAVCVGAEISVLEGIVVGTFVFATIGVDVAITGVKVGTPITTGVGVNMDGVSVAGRKGVGPGKGWITQPLQDVINRSANKLGRVSFFILSPRYLLYLACVVEKSPRLILLSSSLKKL